MYVRMGVRMSRTHLLAAPTTAATVAIAAAEHAWVLFYDAVDILLQLLDALRSLADKWSYRSARVRTVRHVHAHHGE